MNNVCCGLETPFEEVPHLVDTPLKGCDMFVHEGSPSLGCDNVSSNPLVNFHVSPVCSQPPFSPSILLMCPMIFLNFVLLMLIWAVIITCLICLEAILKILGP